MTALADLKLARRALLGGASALVVTFSIARAFGQTPPGSQQDAEDPNQRPELPGSLEDSRFIDGWIRIDPDGKITVFTGKIELGQGIKTALIQIAAEELVVDPGALTLVTADTGRTPDEGFTAGSNSMHDSGVAIRHAAAQARALLVGEAARRMNVQPDQVKAENGKVTGPGGQGFTYAELVTPTFLHVEAQPKSVFKDPKTYKVMGTPMPRVDIPAKVTGGVAYVQDFRPDGMVHARVVRPPSYGATLGQFDASKVETMPGVLKIVRNGSFLAVVAEREFQAIQAMRALSKAAQWNETASLPAYDDIHSVIRKLPTQDIAILDQKFDVPAGTRKFEARFTRPYQMHGSIGPSCSVATFQDGALTVWTHTQGVYPDQKAIAEMLSLPPEKVRCIHMEGSGCYGHNGADDAAADAAVIAHAFPGRPVRVQWMREQEHAWEPYGSGMVTEISASLDSKGMIADWDFGVWTTPHGSRPGGAGNLLAARYLAKPFKPPVPKPSPQPNGSGDRNAIPYYVIPSARVVHHFTPEMPIRVSSLRGLGAYMNVFTIECFMDELAEAAGVDPVEFRLRHLNDKRAKDVVSTAAERFGWDGAAKLPRGRGRGFAFARYKNFAAYCAVAVEVEVEQETGWTRVVRAVAAADSGQIVNPDGLRNQIEGGIIQSSSWTLYENVMFDQKRITTTDWASYPILRFAGVPEKLEVHLIDRPGMEFLGSGECAQGPSGAAIGNAVANALGKRIYDLPLRRERVWEAMNA